MAAGLPRDQALSLLAAANNHCDLAVKLSSLKQTTDILLSAEPSQAAELFPYLVELQSSPETLVRKYLLEIIDEAGAKATEHLFILFPVLLTFLKDNNSFVAKQSIIIGAKVLCIVLEELALQFQRCGMVERWLEELWAVLLKFRDALLGILFEVLHLLSEGRAPPPDLVVTVKHLYETRLKDAAILIPILSAFSKDEVLPVFPRLVQLPLPKFQMALAHILQGSAHTGPALTPVEVLVAIHDISPERDCLPLKKIMDACSACFEQRTVFTQQVLAKALNQMVDRTPLPLLFMRTVIQAIDAFPTLVDFVMEILSKLVNRQVWRMPKLWVGFLKCISQTQPHSSHVLLQLPSPQLESALSKYPNLRGPLTAFMNQSNANTSVPRATPVFPGLAPQDTSSLHASDSPSLT